MKRLILTITITLIALSLHAKIEVYQSYITIYGEGPLGQYPIAFETVTYSEEDAVILAANEIFEFLSAMVYGYNFTYKVENRLNNRKGYFDLIPIALLNRKDRDLRIRQFEESRQSLRFQALYRLKSHEKSYVKGFRSSLAFMSSGTAYGTSVGDWANRITIYKEAIREAILAGARATIKSRPQYIKGRVLLAESPSISLISGEWRVTVKIHLIINEIKYQDSY